MRSDATRAAMRCGALCCDAARRNTMQLVITRRFTRKRLSCLRAHRCGATCCGANQRDATRW
eukprot:260481-Lingulodinium_polyedra.AAC.1